MSENVKTELSVFWMFARFPARARGKHSAGVVAANSSFYWQTTLYRVGPCINRHMIILYSCLVNIWRFFFYVNWNEIIELLVELGRTVISYRLHATYWLLISQEWMIKMIWRFFSRDLKFDLSTKTIASDGLTIDQTLKLNVRKNYVLLKHRYSEVRPGKTTFTVISKILIIFSLLPNMWFWTLKEEIC